MPNMTGRPGYWTMEMNNGGSSVPYLSCTLCFVLRFIGVETEVLLDYQGRAGDHFHCTVEPSPGHIRCDFKSLRFLKTQRLSAIAIFWDAKSAITCCGGRGASVLRQNFHKVKLVAQSLICFWCLCSLSSSVAHAFAVQRDK